MYAFFLSRDSDIFATERLCFLSITWEQHLFILIRAFFLSRDSDTFATERLCFLSITWERHLSNSALRTPINCQTKGQMDGLTKMQMDGQTKIQTCPWFPNTRTCVSMTGRKEKKPDWGLAAVKPGIRSDLHDMIGKGKKKTRMSCKSDLRYWNADRHQPENEDRAKHLAKVSLDVPHDVVGKCVAR